jgi:hypothetical protein
LNNIILWVGNGRNPCLQRFPEAKNKNTITILIQLFKKCASKIKIQAVVGFCVFVLKLLTAIFFLLSSPSPPLFIKSPG